MKRSFPIILSLLASGFLMSGCTVVEESGPYYSQERVIYGGPNPDFYYVGAAPYSRQYGILVYRDGGYYYRRGGGYYVYDRPAWSRHEWERYRYNKWDDSYRRHHDRDTTVVYKTDKYRYDSGRHHDHVVYKSSNKKAKSNSNSSSKKKSSSKKDSDSSNKKKKKKN